MKTTPYIREGVLPIEFVISNTNKENVITPYDVKIKFTSWRLPCYAKNGVKCAHCGKEGSYFAVEKNKYIEGNSYHLNLYHYDVNTNSETMMTIDHIIPKSSGGGNKLSNLQVLCFDCNMKKASDPDPFIK
jgi:5-methylcytosine-specific restriction endonuclease McrA